MATDLGPILGRVLLDLGRLGAQAALVGGLAIGVRTRPRMTKDVDVAVAVSGDPEAERIAGALLRFGYRHHSMFEHEANGRLMTVRLFLPGSDATEPDVDLLFASSGIENEVVEAATTESVLGAGAVRVARTGHLLAMKVLSESDLRPRDRDDLIALVSMADHHERELARAGIELIARRGYSRGKDLPAVLARYLRERL